MAPHKLAEAESRMAHQKIADARALFVDTRAKVTRKTCPLRNDWKSYDAERLADRLFMICPCCGVYGSHINEQ